MAVYFKSDGWRIIKPTPDTDSGYILVEELSALCFKIRDLVPAKRRTHHALLDAGENSAVIALRGSEQCGK